MKWTFNFACQTKKLNSTFTDIIGKLVESEKCWSKSIKWKKLFVIVVDSVFYGSNGTRGMAALYASVWIVLIISDDWKKVQLYKPNSYHTLRYFGIRNYKKPAWNSVSSW